MSKQLFRRLFRLEDCSRLPGRAARLMAVRRRIYTLSRLIAGAVYSAIIE